MSTSNIDTQQLKTDVQTTCIVTSLSGGLENEANIKNIKNWYFINYNS